MTLFSSLHGSDKICVCQKDGKGGHAQDTHPVHELVQRNKPSEKNQASPGRHVLSDMSSAVGYLDKTVTKLNSVLSARLFKNTTVASEMKRRILSMSSAILVLTNADFIAPMETGKTTELQFDVDEEEQHAAPTVHPPFLL